MSARVFSAGQQVDRLAIDDETNNNNNNNNNNSESTSPSDKAKQEQQQLATRRAKPSMRKRASVQSNLSRVSSAGQLCSDPNSSSSQMGDDDEPEGDDELGGKPQQMSNEEYERIRNTTLLFFLDRLCLASHEGKEARTLHDLSCLFGTREFTKEMRQIVGASRNGLKKFLQSYPSLFQIEDDKVHLTQLNGGVGSQAAKRDYNREAVDYFRQKLLQFGTSLVPIKNLFGYRSQASQEVRHVSGKNSRDFKRFLKQNEDVFEILADEYVVLRSALEELESQGLSSLSLQKSLQPLPADEVTTLDPYLNKQLAHLIEDCIRELMSQQQPPAQEDQFKVTLERLYDTIRVQCQNELFLKMLKSIEDLKVFLRMHPRLFKRIPFERDTTNDGQQPPSDTGQGRATTTTTSSEVDYHIGLVSESERRELDLQALRASSLLFRQQSASDQHTPATNSTGSAGQTKANDSDTSKQAATTKIPNEQSAKSTASTNDATITKKSAEGVASVREPKQSLQTSLSAGGKAPPASSNQQQSPASHRLRANAPPFVPSARAQVPNHRPHHQHQSQSVSYGPSMKHLPLQRQSSLITQGHRSAQRPSEQLPINSSQQDARSHFIPEPIQRSVSNLNSPLRSHTSGGFHEPMHMRDSASFERRQPIRGHLVRGTGDQSSNNNNASSWSQHNQHQQPFSPRSESQTHSHEAQMMLPSDSSSVGTPINQEDLRARTVDIVREASNIITKVMTTTDAVAFDCKGYNLGFDGKITLIQLGFLPQKHLDPMQLASSMNKRFASTAPTLVATNRDSNGHVDKDKQANGSEQVAHNDGTGKAMKPEVCVFDLITNPELAYCLKPLLESDKVVKIVHDVRNKSNALHVQFNITLNNVFDTQVANLVIQQQMTGKPAYKSRYISMSKLCEVYGGESLVKYRDMIKIKTSSRGGHSISRSASSTASSSSKDINYWRTRPLTRGMIIEATLDVYCLIGGIYQNLKAQIKPEYRPLFDLLNLEGVLARIKPDEIRSAKKERKIDMEVIDLKRKLYSDSTGPVVLSNREIRLLRHIDLTEGVRQKIQQCKKVAKKIERLDMKAALLAQQQSEGETGDRQPSSLSSPSSSLGPTTGNGAEKNGADSEVEQRREQLQARLDEFNAAVLMMEDNSMFDEFKERLNESTSLLESLENDDDDEDDDEAALQLSSGHHSHNGSSINDCCRCQCHSNQNSLDGVASNHSNKASKGKQHELDPSSGEQDQPGAGACKSHANISKAPEQAIDDSCRESCKDRSSMLRDSKQSDTDNESKGVHIKSNKQMDDEASLTGSENSDGSKSSACDMAIQCDLLS